VGASHILYIPLVFAAGLVVGLWLSRVTRRRDEDE
jgi:uncharacterized protein YneF (UPF0154 family)